MMQLNNVLNEGVIKRQNDSSVEGTSEKNRMAQLNNLDAMNDVHVLPDAGGKNGES